MREFVVILGATLIMAVLAAGILGQGMRVAGVDPRYVRSVPDRVRYNSMGTIVLLTAMAATASLTVALSLVFPTTPWPQFLPVGILWGSIVLNFDRWIVSSIDYGPLTAADMEAGQRPQSGSKTVHFAVRFVMATLVGLVISEPIVLAIFDPEISQQLTVQHTADAQAQTAQIYASERQKASQIGAPVRAAQANLNAATQKAASAHSVYICELTGKCNLPPGEVTGTAGDGPQSQADYANWQTALNQEKADQNVLNTAQATARTQNAALAKQTNEAISKATATINADNGLLAREKALDALSKKNSGFLLRRILLWLTLMFIDLAPVLLKTFSPATLYELLQRSEAVQVSRNAMSDAIDESDYQSTKKAITRQRELKYHREVTNVRFDALTEQVRAAISAAPLAGPAESGFTTPAIAAGPRPRVSQRGEYPAYRSGGGNDPGWVIGRRWLVRRMLADTPSAGRIPFVAVDLYGEYSHEVAVKIIAPPPRIGGAGAASERRHALMEMSLPQGHIHDNIAEILDSDVDPEHGSYIVTQLFPMTLDRYLREATERNTLTIGIALRCGVEILEGLRAAWARGFVHLDLKPANIALTEDLTVKLIDFGLAQQYQKAAGGNYTTTSTARFTMFYAPPEQMERGNQSWISRNADLRALAAVIYRMLTGYPPMFREAKTLGIVGEGGQWHRQDATAVFDLKELIGSVEPVPVSELISYVPSELDILLRTWLRIDPNMRAPGKPQTMPDRVQAHLAAIYEQVTQNGEADYPVGVRVTQEPAFTALRADWPRRAAPGRPGGTDGSVPDRTTGTLRAGGRHTRSFEDPPTVVPPDADGGPVSPADPEDQEPTL